MNGDGQEASDNERGGVSNDRETERQTPEFKLGSHSIEQGPGCLALRRIRMASSWHF